MVLKQSTTYRCIFDPANSEHLILGSDIGVSVSHDRSDNWYQFRNLPIGQFYEIGVDMRQADLSRGDPQTLAAIDEENA